MNLSLLFNTVQHLKARQVTYQLFYRFYKTGTLKRYSRNDKSSNITWLQFAGDLPVMACADEEGNFTFLNKTVAFGTQIDWGYMLNGRLWNYNLQYANYLLQEEIPLQTRLQWLASLHEQLYSGAVLPEPYPVSLRAMNTIRLLCKKRLQDDNILRALYASLNFLSGRFEYHLLGNHLLENAFALMMGGAFFGQEKWINKAAAVLKKELEEQVLRDGGHFELSPMYHQVILFRVLELIDWYRNYSRHRELLLSYLEGVAAAMLGWLKSISFSNGEIPHFNDSAPGIAYSTEQLLSYGAALGIKIPENAMLSESGYRMYRFGAYECVVDVAAIGPVYQAGHGHADTLSFLLHYRNEPVFTEAGTSIYDACPVRYYERSTGAHNTVVVNQANQSEVWGAFRVGSRAITTVIKEEPDTMEARHNGYLKRFGVRHNRSFIFREQRVIIRDDISGRKTVDAIAIFHLHPNVKIIQREDRLFLEGIGTISFQGAGRITLSEYDYADGFNKVIPATQVNVSFDQVLETQIDFE